ncbi:hypothetical protein GGS23DRAFT_511871 [Durotheca rogersii]|uniref:uncharacterized protein n=1 Tax=Durotheca rogersii TaxID=419775 RepID=UPI00221EF9D6|nr:uncharacterized protein GGS23DRAFT_511871 [Durotheca rogersii]KAI5863737.1 hypothetical protein GGS23DRAFT_511871 [Durotheca rogersii]
MDIHQEIREDSLTDSKLNDYLVAGNDINMQDIKTGFTPLATAAKSGRVRVAKLLLEHGANPNQKTKYGCTPLYFAADARTDREGIVRLLLDSRASVDLTDPACHNETPLMAAISKARDYKVVKMLLDAGASLEATNNKNKTARSMGEQSDIPLIREAVAHPYQLSYGQSEWLETIIKLILFILAYIGRWFVDGTKGVVAALYGVREATEPDENLADEIGNPTTAEQFKESINTYIKDKKLDDFFDSGDRYLHDLAEKALELEKDPRNHFTEPDEIKSLVQLALFQPIFYCDDSGSMNARLFDPPKSMNGMDAQRELVKRMARVATRLVPDNTGAHLRFINRTEGDLDDLGSHALEQRMLFMPRRTDLTNIGTELEAKILKPLVYDVIERDGRLKRPILVLIITDGQPFPEPLDTLKRAILECGQRLSRFGYQNEAVTFLISQVGNDPRADQFLDLLEGDPELDRVLYRTAGRLHEKYESLGTNQKDIERWLLHILAQPILGLRSAN